MCDYAQFQFLIMLQADGVSANYCDMIQHLMNKITWMLLKSRLRAFIIFPNLCVCLSVLTLQIIDEEETQFMTNCPPAVTESTPRRRTSIEVFWTAPPSGSGCVFLKYVYSSGC